MGAAHHVSGFWFTLTLDGFQDAYTAKHNMSWNPYMACHIVLKGCPRLDLSYSAVPQCVEWSCTWQRQLCWTPCRVSCGPTRCVRDYAQGRSPANRDVQAGGTTAAAGGNASAPGAAAAAAADAPVGGENVAAAQAAAAAGDAVSHSRRMQLLGCHCRLRHLACQQQFSGLPRLSYDGTQPFMTPKTVRRCLRSVVCTVHIDTRQCHHVQHHALMCNLLQGMPGMAFMMDAYEQELKRPIRNVVNGQLPRTLLIQVHAGCA